VGPCRVWMPAPASGGPAAAGDRDDGARHEGASRPGNTWVVGGRHR
jgi:hypothetical protein